MIIPSVDLQSGNAVQLERGQTLRINAGDPRPIAQRFGRLGEIAVIDLDAALATGSNASTITDLLALAPCRVGGGIRDVDTARRWLDLGARKVILGTAATPDILRHLPRQRVIAALDARNGEIVTHGWTQGTGAKVADRIAALRPYVAGFLVTFVEVEGTMQGLPFERAVELQRLVGDARLTVAGGVRDASEIGELDALGIDAQIGMALYSGRFTLADALAACLTTDRPDGLWPTLVTDERGTALGLCYSNAQSLHAALEEGRGVYYSRSRAGLWRKGATSGDAQTLLAVRTDCDRDALLFVVRQEGRGFCHEGVRSCFRAAGAAEAHLAGLPALERRLRDPATTADPASYTARLLNDPALLASKLREEAQELIDAASPAHAAAEAADLFYFALARLIAAGGTLEQVEHELDRRALKLTRRPGDAKPSHQPPDRPTDRPRGQRTDHPAS